MFDFGFIYALIPIAPFAVGGLAIWTTHKRKTLQLELDIAKARAMERPPVNDRLEERVRTLERIITDGRSRDDLSQQIEDLRTKQLS
ncbi:hypothetical protein [Blastomonas aquatica]|uniref:Phage shock protein B n=1 Tax=Blastomonas aquatica TaxID=1510276 RepID=A0ABQ1J5M6_9SPHN|nr:hypothetical protein [Blastomonas aquatica]GGB59419.1 hypothetical protein GCM10010833_12800 [Blastomonas aquatica]